MVCSPGAAASQLGASRRFTARLRTSCADAAGVAPLASCSSAPAGAPRRAGVRERMRAAGCGEGAPRGRRRGGAAEAHRRAWRRRRPGRRHAGRPHAGSAWPAGDLRWGRTCVRKAKSAVGRNTCSACDLAGGAQTVVPSEDQTSILVRTRAMTSSVNSVVPAWPPRSGVRTPDAVASSTRLVDRPRDAVGARAAARRRRSAGPRRRPASWPSGWRRPCPAAPARCRAAPRPSRPACLKSSSNASSTDSAPAIEPNIGMTRSLRQSPSRLSAGITSGLSAAPEISPA